MVFFRPGNAAGQQAADSTVVPNPYARYEAYIYNRQTKSKNLSYNYSNIWDLDGDDQKDSVYFLGNDGAHTYFYLRIILSSNNLQKDFMSAKIDIPYLPDTVSLEKLKRNPAVQFVVKDFNRDNIPDIYLNFDNNFSAVSGDWRKRGIRTKHVVISFKRGVVRVKDY